MKSESARLPIPVVSKSQKQLVEKAVAILRSGLNIQLPPKVTKAATKGRAGVQELLSKAPEIAQAYTEHLKSYRDLAVQYNCTLPTIQALLLSQGVSVRKPGRVFGKDNDGGHQQSKISPVQRRWMLDQDLKGTPHTDIAVILGVSRERVRQLCERAGHEPRRKRMKAEREATVLAKASHQQASKDEARSAPPSDEAVAVSLLWRSGNDIKQIAASLKRNPNSLGVQIVRWRQRWPTMFCRRYKHHVTR